MIENVRLPSASRYPCRVGHNIAAFLWEMEGGKDGRVGEKEQEGEKRVERRGEMRSGERS